jgi:hypothetical protein
MLSFLRFLAFLAFAVVVPSALAQSVTPFVPAARAVNQVGGPPIQNQSSGKADEITEIEGHRLRNLRDLIGSRSTPSSVFPILHEERRWAIDEERWLTSRIGALRARVREVSGPVQVISREEYEERTRRLNSDIDENQRKQLVGPTESDKVDAHLMLISLTRQKGALGAAWEESQRFEIDKRGQEGISADLDAVQRDITRVRDYLLSLDDNINSMLLTTDANNDFKKWISISFSVLVGLVIIGFFAIAMREKGIRDIIFSNDSGLQFVTLFSIVIAIILFGVINVLEGRELAALLGGLSGYILGRGSFAAAVNSSQLPGAADHHPPPTAPAKG